MATRPLWLLLLLAAACAPLPAESPCAGRTCDRGAFLAGKADVAADWCATYGWYDDPDGYCDDPGGYCAQPDPDCGEDVDGCGDTDLSAGMIWQGDPAVGCVAPTSVPAAERRVDVLFTQPFCEVCTPAQKEVLLGRSPIIARVVALIDGASDSVSVAQYTFSRREIEAALVRAFDRGVEVRVAMDAAQDRDGSVARRLLERGLDVRFVQGRPAGGHMGLMHDKLMLVDGATLLTGSNNWSSTGTSINEENTVVVSGGPGEPQVAAFVCHFEALWNADPDAAAGCSRGDVAFSPSAAGKNMVRDAIRDAERSVDVLMHHLTFDDLVKELARAQERGVQVRLVVNEADRPAYDSSSFRRLFAAGGRIRFKRGNDDAYQLMHDKLAIIDGRLVVNGSGNWSGSGFFVNYENYVTYREPPVARAFARQFERLWTWSLSPAALDGGWTAAEQDRRTQPLFFGNLHAHMASEAGGQLLDDGRGERNDERGEPHAVPYGKSASDAARFAFEYARDRGGLDFMALSPHCADHSEADQASQSNMTPDGYDDVMKSATDVSAESAGTFLALPSMEWSTNSTGNHVGVLGSSAIAKTQRGRFDLFYEDFLAGRVALGEQPIVMMNHPRTFRMHDLLRGSWDQVFGVRLTDIRSGSERRHKFNDYGLDDFEPLRGVHDSWVRGTAMPDPAVVDETLANLWAASSPYARLMEVTLNRGKELRAETPRNPSIVPQQDGSLGRRTKVHTDWDYYLSHGFRLAPVASHDNHYANWGRGHTSRTAVFAAFLDRGRLLAALRARAVYASEDPNLELRFFMDGRHRMGSETATIARTMSVQVYVADPDSSGPFELALWGGRLDGQRPAVVRTASTGPGWVALEVPIAPGVQYYYVEVHDTGADRMAWSAPIWVDGL